MQTKITNQTVQNKNIDKIKSTERDFVSGYISGPMGYKFRTRDFLNVIFLYINSVDTKNPDILGKTNKNTFIYEAMDAIEKIKEQVRLDVKDMNFLIHGAQSLGRFVVRAANRKVLDENEFAEHMDKVVDDAVDFGSGFLKVWKDTKGKLKMKSVDPYKLIFNQYNFAEGRKIEIVPKTYRAIIADEKYDQDQRNLLAQNVGPDDLDKFVEMRQSVSPVGEDKTLLEVILIDGDKEYYLFGEELDVEDTVQYFKFDYKKRAGFPDALGVGANEKIFNLIVQDKVNRERMDTVMTIMTKMPFQQQVDPQKQDFVGKEMVKIKDTMVMGYKDGNPVEPMNLGGEKQYNVIRGELNDLTGKVSQKLNVGDALAGNTLPSGASGALGTLLTENQGSVHKEVQKNYAKFLSRVYKAAVTPYILSVFDSEENVEKYLSKNDIRTIKIQVMNYLLALKEVDAAIADEPFDVVTATEEVKKEMDGEPIISGELLEQLREEVQGIETFISGEQSSKAATVAFYREMRSTFATNPQLFKSPFFVELLKAEAQYESGITGTEIDNMLKELDNDPLVNQQEQASLPTG